MPKLKFWIFTWSYWGDPAHSSLYKGVKYKRIFKGLSIKTGVL